MTTPKVRTKKCKNCGKPFEVRRPLQCICGSKCAYEYAMRKKESLQRKENAAEKAKRRQDIQNLREKVKTASDHKKELQALINKIVRTIDYGQPCISSGRKWKENDQAGHYFTTGAYPELRFNLWVIHSQSVSDNLYKSGNVLEFRRGLEKRYGDWVLDYLHTLRIEHKGRKFTIDEIFKAKLICKEILKQLPEKKIYTPDQLTELRKQFNNQIGLY